MKTNAACTLAILFLSFNGVSSAEDSVVASLKEAILRPGTGEYDFPAVECELQWFQLHAGGKLNEVPVNDAPMPRRLLLNRVRNYDVGASLYYHNADVFGRYSVGQVPRLPDLNVVASLSSADAAVVVLGQPYVRWRGSWVWGFVSGAPSGSFEVLIVRIRFDGGNSPTTKWVATGKITDPAKAKSEVDPEIRTSS